jgi:hypothetical protein
MPDQELELKQRVLQQLSEEIPSGTRLEISNQSNQPTVLQAELETAATQQQDTAEAAFTTAGIDAETAGAAAAVLAQEDIDPRAMRSAADQQVLVEAYTQIKQEVDLGIAQQLNLSQAVTTYVLHSGEVEEIIDQIGYPNTDALSHANTASDIYKSALENGVSEEAFQSAVSVVQSAQQQDRVDQVAPIVAAFLDANGTYEVEGTRNTAVYNPESQILTVTDNEAGNTFLKAQRDVEGWKNLGSEIRGHQLKYFVGEVQPQIQTIQRQERSADRGIEP